MTKLSWIRAAAILLLLTLLSFQTTAQEDDGVVSVLTDELDISSSKARGGAGAIFAYAKDNLDDYDFDSSMGGKASLADSFDQLDIDPEMISEFLPVVYDYVESVSGERAMELLEELFIDGF